MLNIICLKHGDKYPPVYVNKLYSMTMRHLTVPHRFICFTDNSAGLFPTIEVKMLPKNSEISGWWWKLYLFNEELFSEDDTNFFMDLDTVIVNNIDHLVLPEPQFVGLKDVSRIFNVPVKLGSAIMKWSPGCFKDLWPLVRDSKSIITQFRGDQDVIWHRYQKEIKFFPESAIKSYKWEIRSINELYRSPTGWRFKNVRNPEIPIDTSIIVFHGTPNLHEVFDPIIVDNWR